MDEEVSICIRTKKKEMRLLSNVPFIDKEAIKQKTVDLIRQGKEQLAALNKKSKEEDRSLEMYEVHNPKKQKRDNTLWG